MKTLNDAYARAHALLLDDPMWAAVIRIEIRDDGSCSHYYNNGQPNQRWSESRAWRHRLFVPRDTGGTVIGSDGGGG